jgi:hypothetical protein
MSIFSLPDSLRALGFHSTREYVLVSMIDGDRADAKRILIAMSAQALNAGNPCAVVSYRKHILGGSPWLGWRAPVRKVSV